MPTLLRFGFHARVSSRRGRYPSSGDSSIAGRKRSPFAPPRSTSSRELMCSATQTAREGDSPGLAPGAGSYSSACENYPRLLGGPRVVGDHAHEKGGIILVFLPLRDLKLVPTALSFHAYKIVAIPFPLVMIINPLSVPGNGWEGWADILEQLLADLVQAHHGLGRVVQARVQV